MATLLVVSSILIFAIGMVFQVSPIQAQTSQPNPELGNTSGPPVNLTAASPFCAQNPTYPLCGIK